MALLFQKDQNVTIKVFSPTGRVKGFKVDDDGQVLYLVEWVDAQGEMQQRWFPEGEIIAG
jgi:hypothetical protein